MLDKGIPGTQSYLLLTVCSPIKLNPLAQLLHYSCPWGWLQLKETDSSCVLQVLRSYIFGPILFSFGDRATHNEMQNMLLDRAGRASKGKESNKKCTRDMGSLPTPVTILSIYKSSLFNFVQLLYHVIMTNKSFDSEPLSLRIVLFLTATYEYYGQYHAYFTCSLKNSKY